MTDSEPVVCIVGYDDDGKPLYDLTREGYKQVARTRGRRVRDLEAILVLEAGLRD